MGTANYASRLKAFDEVYFGNEPKKVGLEKAAQRLATHLFDQGFEFSDEHLETYLRLQTEFPELWTLVLINLFTKNHDT